MAIGQTGWLSAEVTVSGKAMLHSPVPALSQCLDLSAGGEARCGSTANVFSGGMKDTEMPYSGGALVLSGRWL